MHEDIFFAICLKQQSSMIIAFYVCIKSALYVCKKSAYSFDKKSRDQTSSATMGYMYYMHTVYSYSII